MEDIRQFGFVTENGEPLYNDLIPEPFSTEEELRDAVLSGVDFTGEGFAGETLLAVEFCDHGPVDLCYREDLGMMYPVVESEIPGWKARSRHFRAA